MTSSSTGGGSHSLETPLNFANIASQRSSLAAVSDDGALSSNASTIPITDRSSPSTETPLLSMVGGAGPLESLPSSSCSSTTISNNSRAHQSNSGSDAPPALPPRPPNLPIPNGALEEGHSHLPPHAFPHNQDSRLYSERAPLSHHQHHHHHHPSSSQSHEDLKKTWWKRITKKYVLLCILCGGVCILLGVLFGVIFFLLRHYTSSLHYFQTLPTYIPSIMLILTGVMVLCFGRRGNRNGYLIKICGAFCLLSALVCVVVTVTTTVIHMNRLQTLRECVYQGSSKTCTCFAGILLDPTIHHDATLRYVFANAPNCEVIHGILYSCLRAMFGLSVIGILVCIFSSMLVYQLLSHEKKKKYWEQLEVRCQHLYRHSPPTLGGSSGSPHCGCCFDSSAHSTSGLRSHPTSSCHWPNAALDLLDERYWPLNRNGPPSSITNTSSNHQQQISTVENLSSSNNIYSPNPSSVGPDTLLTSLSSSDPSSTHPEVVSRSISLRSMRTWFRRLSRAESPSGRRPGRGHSNGGYPGTLSHPTYIPSLHPHLHHHHHHPLHHHHPRMHLHQLWRLSSHSDSQYGFRVPPSSTSISLPEPPLPQYQPPHHVLWGPPPPYSNSNSNINHPSPTQQQAPQIESSPSHEERTELSSSLPTSSSPPLQTAGLTNTLTSTTSSKNPVCRTTKSGLLMDKVSDFDETVKSAMHIYSKTASLPSRRPKKPRGSIDPSYAEIPLSAKSLADITKDNSIEEELEALSVHEVRRKLKTLGLYKVHQRSKTARELAEIRQALNDLQGKSESYYYATSSNGDSSTNENKYETIGQSIRPYKIPEPPINASTTPDSSISSHYAQISPLHGTGLPSGAMSSTPNSPIKSYFKEIVRSSDLQSLPIEAIRGGDDPQVTPPILTTPYSSQLLHSLNSVGARKGFHKSSSSSMEILSPSADHSALLCPLPMRRSGVSSSNSANNTPQKLSNSDTILWNSNSHLKNTPPSTINNSNKRKSTPVQQCVYLRPEQNIPDIFGNAAFKPILDGLDSNFKNSGASRRASEEEGSRGDAVISRDDIVVAMRSVNV
ncbi:uncharacterized protein [Lepeophtheirus salmonis]|uniref:uncharacterized protein isoform X2 n=1 Tax=Lepeophtheirus salmonis TaxID=72036 RepID=UPI001AE5FE5E|nr:uncharacterized protein LOC121114753 isoform X2 [Lepeophtheirus salmonis]